MCGKLLRTTILFIYTFINEIDDLMGFIWRRRGGKKRNEEGEEVHGRREGKEEGHLN